jgi:integrase/recombinase XerD
VGGWWSHEKTTYQSIDRFKGHVQLKGLRERTVEAYVAMVRLLSQWCAGDPAELEEERVRAYFLHLVREKGLAPQTVRQARAALTAYYVEMLGRREWRVFSGVKTKDKHKLPVVLSREEVRQLLGAVVEERFAVPLRLIYLCGLRLSEALHLEVGDIDRQRLRLHVRDGKGGKDRYVPLPQAGLDMLAEHWKTHRHPRYLFPAMGHAWRTTERRDPVEEARAQQARRKQAPHPMSTSGMQRVFLLAVRGSGLNKKATIHTLRHSYATHLLEEGVSLRYVSAYLGHSSLDQTLVYAHLTEVSEEQTQRATSRLAAALTGGA